MLTDLISLYIAGTLSSDTPFSANSFEENKIREPIPQIELTVAPIPSKKDQYVEPIVKARAAAIVDLETGEYLYKKNIYEKLQIASITKLMTAVVALDKGNLEDTVLVSNKASLTEGSKIWLYKDEQISLRNLLYAIVIHSANDAAVAVAEHISGSEKEFVVEMNKKARDLNLYNTSFQNPVGFDHAENYSTVEDLVKLGRFAYKNELINDASKKSTMTIASTDGEITHDLESTNDLLDSFINYMGLKTGHTEMAGLCFISIAEKDGTSIMTVVLNSPDRFKETKVLSAWAFKSFLW